jgi:predicted AAA+ superfamily ATPase
VDYLPRLVDAKLAEWLGLLPAIAIEGAKGVGKTESAKRVAADVFSVDSPVTRANLEADPELVLTGRAPTLIDEWQIVPPVWDVVRRAVDPGAAPGRFLLAGSAAASPGARTHSGAGRIVRLLMRPLSLPERGLEQPSVSLAGLLAGTRPQLGGDTRVKTVEYVREILDSGFPGIRQALPPARGLLLDSYLDRIVDHDVPAAGRPVREPGALRAWLTAYAAATSTTASYSALLDAAAPGRSDKPSRPTAAVYRELLSRIWVLDPVPAWVPRGSHLKRLAQGPKHYLVDPALAARLVGATQASLINEDGQPGRPKDGTFLGALFESLAVQTVRVLAEQLGCRVSHFRDRDGREVDVIVQRPDGRVVAIDVKLSGQVRPADVATLNWLDQSLPGCVLDKVLLNTSDRALRRPDGVAVIPLALLGP